MPSNVVQGFADKTGKSVPEVEAVWEKAKAAAKEQYTDVAEDSDQFYAIVTGITKKMLGINESFTNLVESELFNLQTILIEMELAEEAEMLTPEEKKEEKKKEDETEKNTEDLTKKDEIDGKTEEKVAESEDQFTSDADKKMDDQGKEPVFGSEDTTTSGTQNEEEDEVPQVNDEDIFIYDDDQEQEKKDAEGASVAESEGDGTDLENQPVMQTGTEGTDDSTFDAGEGDSSYSDDFSDYNDYDDLTGEDLGDDSFDIALDQEIASYNDFDNYDINDTESMTGVDVVQDEIKTEAENLNKKTSLSEGIGKALAVGAGLVAADVAGGAISGEANALVRKLNQNAAMRRKKRAKINAEKGLRPEQKKRYHQQLKREAQADKQKLAALRAKNKAARAARAAQKK